MHITALSVGPGQVTMAGLEMSGYGYNWIGAVCLRVWFFALYLVCIVLILIVKVCTGFLMFQSDNATLNEVLMAHPDKREAIMDEMKQILTPMAQK